MEREKRTVEIELSAERWGVIDRLTDGISKFGDVPVPSLLGMVLMAGVRISMEFQSRGASPESFTDFIAGGSGIQDPRKER